MEASVGAGTDLLAISHPALNSAARLHVLFRVYSETGKLSHVITEAYKSTHSL